MRGNLAGSKLTFLYPFSAGLLMLLSGCSLLQKKSDPGPDAQASVAPVASIAPLLPTAAPSTAPVPSVAIATHARVQTHTHTGTATATASAAASVAPVPSGVPVPPPIPGTTGAQTATATATAATPGILNPECQQACQKGYQDCMTQSGVTGMELIKKCRQVLMPCLQACK